MRHVDGTDLRALLRREGPLDPARAIAIAAQVASALDAAHEHGLVHRDVKPSNVLLDARGHCYLADFGLTDGLDEPGPADGSLGGTVDYVAPEQIRGDPVDRRADVYGLGCLLFEALTGRVPFPRASGVATIFAHLDEEPPAATAVRASLPAALDAVLVRALAKEPAARQASCGELVQEARIALDLEPRRRRRRTVATATVVALAAVAALALAVALLRDGGAGARPAGELVRIDPATGRVAARQRLSPSPDVAVVAGGRVWVGDFEEGALYAVEPGSGTVQRIPAQGQPRDLAALGDSVYVASDGAELLTGTVTRYDGATGVRQSGVDLLACAVGAGDGFVWAAGCPSAQRLSSGPGSLRVEADVEVPYPEHRSAGDDRIAFRDVAVGEGAVWLLGDPVDRRVYRLDERTGRVLSIVRLPFAGRSIAAGEGGVWVSAPLDDLVGRLDPRTGRLVATVPTGRGTSGVAAGAGSVWVANAIAGSVSQIDPRTNAVSATIDVGGRPREVAVGAGGVWVTGAPR
jgi:YVTN family beta-propeller protein